MIVGIDPGASGAIAWLSTDGHLIEVHDLPVQKINGRSELMPSVLGAMLRRPFREPVHAYLERVHVKPTDGKVGAFSFGRNFGMIEGVLAALAVPVTLITPGKWKGGLRLAADKGASRHRAAQLWPGAAAQFARVKDDGRAEAALIGHYAATMTPRMAA